MSVWWYVAMVALEIVAIDCVTGPPSLLGSFAAWCLDTGESAVARRRASQDWPRAKARWSKW